MTGFLRRVLLVLALGCAPSLVWAQGGPDYQTLTLAEAAYLHSGLALQAILRNSSLRHLPQVIMVCCTIWLVYRRVTSARPQPLAGIVAYLVSCGLILTLFWPEASIRFGLAGAARVVGADGTISWVAQQNGMPWFNARDSNLVPTQLRGDAVVPRALDLILRAVTEMPLLLARGIHPNNMERPFSRVPVLQQFVEDVATEPPPGLARDMARFAPLCYEAAIQRLMTADPNRTQQDIVPWSPLMAAELANIPIALGGGGPQNCSELYVQMENEAVAHLRAQATAQGSNKGQVVEDELDISVREQARIFAQKELERQVLDVQAPNQVVAAKRALDAASAAASAFSQFDLTAPFKSLGSQLEKHLDRMSRFLGIGSFLVYWGPYMVGIAMFATLSFFPVVLLWSLFPGQHFKPLVNYFLLLIFVCSTPLWWAMVDAAAEVAYAQHPTGGWFEAPTGWGLAYTSYMVVTVLGIVMVPVMQATLLFGSWRAIGGIWHG